MEISHNENHFIINVDFSIPENEKKTFHTIFNYIRKKLQLKLVRKNNIDSLLKKSKGKFFKTVFESIKLCLNLKVSRLPQNFITNITIEYNQIYLQKKIIEIYNEFKLLPSIEDIINKNLCKKGKMEIFKEIANSDFYTLYDNYINSDRFKRDIEQIKKEEGKRNGILYEFVAKNFCVYYLFSKGHPNKEKKNSLIEDKKKEKKILFKVSSLTNEKNIIPHSFDKKNKIIDKQVENVNNSDLNVNIFDE